MTDLNAGNGSQPIGAPDPFSNLESLRLDQSFADQVGVKKLLTTVPCRKPNRQDFVRVNPDPAYRLTPAALVEWQEDREVYYCTPEMAAELPGEFFVATLFTAINKQGVHHGHRATDDDRVLSAGHRDVKSGDIPVVDLVGPGWRPGTDDRQPEYATDN
jgi:hypothetical protein